MISSEQMDVIRVIDLQTEDEGEHFNAKLASVHIIAEEEVLHMRGVSEFLEDVEQIEELAMDIAYYHHRRC